MAITTEGTYQDFAYTGGVQTFTVPYTGLYKLEVWGAQGDHDTRVGDTGGLGGYSLGYKRIKKNTVIYIACGGKGTDFNGGSASRGDGTNAKSAPGAGGATHIASDKYEIYQYAKAHFDIVGLIVAGGGGGAKYNTAGNGGGLTGGSASYSDTGGGGGGTQTSAGSTGTTSGGATILRYSAFGLGGRTYAGIQDGGSGGGGYYGGGSGTNGQCGGGGSGWIGGVPTITYKGTTYSPSTSNGVNSGNGKARITLVKKDFPTIIYNGTTLEGINFNGTEVDTVVFNGVTLE